MHSSFTQPGRPVRIPDAALERYPHACAYFPSLEQQYAFTMPFVKEGPERFREELAARPRTLGNQ